MNVYDYNCASKLRKGTILYFVLTFLFRVFNSYLLLLPSYLLLQAIMNIFSSTVSLYYNKIVRVGMRLKPKKLRVAERYQ